MNESICGPVGSTLLGYIENNDPSQDSLLLQYMNPDLFNRFMDALSRNTAEDDLAFSIK